MHGLQHGACILYTSKVLVISHVSMLNLFELSFNTT